jgi:hypothetical protein
MLRQFSSNYAIHARRNLPDKELRYLRTVIVTAAVHQGLDSKREPLLVTFWHWAGVSPYTSSCDLAETCVFDKQFLEIFNCGLTPISKYGHRQGLSLSYTCCFAEFLSIRLLDRLGILYLSTGVGLWYGNLISSLPRYFSSVELAGITLSKTKHFTS